MDEVKGPYPTFINSTAVPGRPKTVPVMTAYFGSRCECVIQKCKLHDNVFKTAAFIPRYNLVYNLSDIHA